MILNIVHIILKICNLSCRWFWLIVVIKMGRIKVRIRIMPYKEKTSIETIRTWVLEISKRNKEIEVFNIDNKIYARNLKDKIKHHF